MSDLLFLSFVPEADIQWHAKARSGLWNTRLRKRRWAIEQSTKIEMRERTTDLAAMCGVCGKNLNEKSGQIQPTTITQLDGRTAGEQTG